MSRFHSVRSRIQRMYCFAIRTSDIGTMFPVKNCNLYWVEVPSQYNPIKSHMGYRIFKACFNGNINLVKIMIANGVDINVKNKKGIELLMYACECERYDIVQYLVSMGANVHGCNHNATTPLIICSQHESLLQQTMTYNGLRPFR